jgi:hypothetical protein
MEARPSYPTVIVPLGMVPNAPTPPLPNGFNAKPLPFGATFTGLACSEPRPRFSLAIPISGMGPVSLRVNVCASKRNAVRMSEET